MPASMISAPTGGRPYVIGSSIAMVASGPMPGSTPISVPTSAPTRQSPRLVGVTAIEKPNQRFAKRSMGRSSEPRPELQRQVEPVGEQERAEQGEHRAPDQRFDPADLFRRVGRNHERHDARDHLADRPPRDGGDKAP